MPKAPRMPVWSRSAPAHESILLMRSTCHGWTRTRMWKASLPAAVVRYLLQAMRAASSAFDETCSFSMEIRCAQNGKAVTASFLAPRS